MIFIISVLGSMLVHGVLMNQSIMSYVPNTYTGLAPVDMGMIIPKTGLAVNIPNMFGGVDIQLVLPRYVKDHLEAKLPELPTTRK